MLQGRRGGLDPILETALRLIGLRYISQYEGIILLLLLVRKYGADLVDGLILKGTELADANVPRRFRIANAQRLLLTPYQDLLDGVALRLG